MAGDFFKVISFSQLLAAVAGSMCTFCVGYTVAYTSPALPTMTKKAPFVVTPQAASWVGGIMPLAAFVGGICGGPLIMYLGRKGTILLTGIPFISAWLLIAFARSVAMVLAGRILGGFAVGVTSLTLPVFLGESLHPHVRGTLGLMSELLGNLGLVTCFVIGSVTNWSKLAFVGAALCIPYLIMMIYVPESPRWYVTRGKEEKALQSLTWLRRKDADVVAELKEMAQSHSDAMGVDSTTCKELFVRKNIKPVVISVALMIFQQLSGFNAVIFYTVMIFNISGSSIDSNVSTIILGVVNFIATFAATILVDRLGRKVLLYISNITMILTLFVVCGYYYCKSRGMNISNYGWLPLACFVIYVMSFALGFGPIPWLMMGEILPSRIRGPAASIVVGVSWACTFLVTKSFQDMLDLLGTHGTFAAFCFVCIIALIFVIAYVPETKNKSLEEIEEELTK